jgi:hypothetical protein
VGEAFGFRTWDEGRGLLDERDVGRGTDDLNAWTLIGTDDNVTARYCAHVHGLGLGCGTRDEERGTRDKDLEMSGTWDEGRGTRVRVALDEGEGRTRVS